MEVPENIKLVIESTPATTRVSSSKVSNPVQSNPSSGSPHKAVVIGAGLGGLSVAIQLARRGWIVDVLEKNDKPGGRMNVIQEQGFTIDMGPTMLMMPEVIADIFRSCERNMNDYLDLKRLLPAYRLQWLDGKFLDMGMPMEQMVAQVRDLAPEDADSIPDLYRAMADKYENARYNFIERPFNSMRHMLRKSTLSGMIRALPLESVYSFVSRYLKSERMREAFTFQTLYLGMSPMDCPAIYALLPYIEAEFGIWYPQGGTSRLASALERLLLDLGGRVHYHTTVTGIEITGKSAKGVRDADGAFWGADVVVCNQDVPKAYQDLVPVSVRKKYSNKKIASYEYGCSGFLLYLGVKKMQTEWKHNMIVLNGDYKTTLRETCKTHQLSVQPALHVCIPTLTDPTLAPPGHDVVYVLAPCPNTLGKIDWEQEAKVYRERILDTLESSGLPGLRENIVFEQQMTPPEFETKYGCYAGSAYASLTPSFLQSAYFRPHCKSEDVDRLYFVGAGTHPGGGVPIVLTSGRIAAEEIVHNFAKRNMK